MDEKGVPLGIVLVGANLHDVSQLGAVLDSKIAHQPDTAKAVRENLCADAGYVGETADAIIRKHGYIPHVRPRGEEIKAKKNKRFKPRRWSVEVSHSWFNNFRKLKVLDDRCTQVRLPVATIAQQAQDWTPAEVIRQLYDTVSNRDHTEVLRSRSALPITLTELNAMAAAAIMGDSKMPKAG